MEIKNVWNTTSPVEGSYICRMSDRYIKMCYFTGEKWLDMWSTDLKNTVTEWMHIPYDEKDIQTKILNNINDYLNMKIELKKPKDTIVESVIEQFKQRSEAGINKYGVTLDRTDLTRLEWLQHAQEEAMDMILYLEKLKQYEK